MTGTAKKRGFSVMECVIAIFVITIVTLSAVSVATSSIRAKAKNAQMIVAQNFARDAWECFKVAQNETEFLSYMKFAVGEDLTVTNDLGKIIYARAGEENNFTATITITPTDSTVAFEVVTAIGEEELLRLTYNKAKGGTAWR